MQNVKMDLSTVSSFDSRQRGMTMLGIVLLGALMVVWVLSIIKLTPVYIEHNNIKEVFRDYEQSVKAREKNAGTNKRKVEAYFSRAFQVNNVRDVSEKNIKLENKLKGVSGDKPKVVVTLAHNFEVPMVGNLYYLVKAEYSATVDKISEEEIE